MKKKTKQRIFAALATVALALPVGLSLGSKAQAADGDNSTATVTLHKLVYDKDTMPTTIPEDKKQNTGGVMPVGPDHEKDGFTGEALKDVTFDVYDVTAEFYAERADAKGDSTKSQDQIKAIYKKLTPADGTKVDTQITGDNGEAIFNRLKKMSKDNSGKAVDAVYLFHETKTPATVTTMSPDMVIGYPVYQQKEDGTYTDTELTDIHLYPKNENDTPEITKELDKDLNKDLDKDHKPTNGFTVGMPVYFNIKVRIPERIADVVKNEKTGLDEQLYGAFYTEDAPSDNLMYQVNPDVEGLYDNKGNKLTDIDFHTIPNGNGFKLYYNNKTDETPNYEQLRKYHGQELTFKFTMYLTDNAKPEVGESNSAILHYTNTPNDNEKTITPPAVTDIMTYGKKLVKIDADSKQKLTGAQFIVKNSDSKFLQKVTDGKETKWGPNDYSGKDTQSVKVFTSGEDGVIDISGLAVGKYTLVEVKTSDKGYVLPNKGVEFEVTKDSYNDKSDPLQEVPNKHKGTLPSTGGKGIYAFIAVGVIALIIAGIYFTRGRKHLEA
ncbi:SpaH/EbpB family LPXTG-anchored major pilin [Enterococcus devriesei]|uniref:SpaH/EbpB family LPXTG-anchored major pilin n=1 Tax=Enterococcus devriesei TaxID=319970 RepID=UPI00288E80F7|nr:SpaH/EbpB family LPXTG-anchored major pilin [Enterococcus devriesei]MDT2821111.1 SpaH/EbpB family LPXTG-anchored major pilin [Enterococcus devriesei]